MKPHLISILLAFVSLIPLQASIYSEDISKYMDVIKRSAKDKLQEGEAKQVLTLFRKQAKAQKLPANIINVVTEETIFDWYYTSKDRTVRRNYYVYTGDGMIINLIERNDDRYSVAICYYLIEPKDVTWPLEKPSLLNPLTKKPYFSLPAKLAEQLENPEHMKLVHKILNENFSIMMPVYHLNSASYKRGHYLGKVINRPLMYFGKELQFVRGDTPAAEVKLRNQLGYLGLGFDEMSKYPQLYVAGNAYEGNQPGTTVEVYFHPGGDVYRTKCVNTTKHFALMEKMQIEMQMLCKARYFTAIHSRFHKMMEEAGVPVATDPRKKGLTPEQQVWARWGNAMDHYMLRMDAYNLFSSTVSNGRAPISDAEKRKMPSYASFIGKESLLPLSAKDKKKAASIIKKLDPKRSSEDYKSQEKYQRKMPKLDRGKKATGVFYEMEPDYLDL